MSDLSRPAALILAGGLGTRLRQVVSDRVKPMAEVEGRPFIHRLLDQLISWDIHQAVLCTGHLGERAEAVLGSRYRSLDLSYSREEVPLGTGGALRLAASRVDTELVLAMNGDSYFGIDFAVFESWHMKAPAQVSLALRSAASTSQYGRVELNADGQVTGFFEKEASEGPGWINGGIYLMPRTRLLEIPEGRAISLEREVFPSWIGHLRGFKAEGPFLDIGTAASYAAAGTFFASLHPDGQS